MRPDYQGRLKWGGKVTTFKEKSISIVSAPLISLVPAGLYMISVYAETGGLPGTGFVTFSVEFTSDSGAKTLGIPADLNLAAGNSSTGSAMVHAFGTINLSTTYIAAGTYSAWVLVERKEGP